MKKWIPFYGMFTKEANDISSCDIDTNLMMLLWHGLICGGAIIAIFGWLILSPK